LTNSGFEIKTGGSYRTPWTDSETGKAYTFDISTGSDVYYSIYTRNENNYRTYFGTTQDDTDGVTKGTLILQQRVTVPTGIAISVTVWVKSLCDASTDAFTFELRFDSITVATYSPTQDQKNVWTPIGTTDASQAILVVPAQGSSTQHTVSLRVTTQGFANKDIFAADDFSITAIAGPGNVPIC